MQAKKDDHKREVAGTGKEPNLEENQFPINSLRAIIAAGSSPQISSKRYSKSKTETCFPGKELQSFPFRKIHNEIESTVPSGVALIKPSISPAYQDEGLHVAVIRVQRLEKHREKLRKWRAQLEKKFPIGVHFQEEPLEHDVRKQLAKYADGDGILRDFSKLPDAAEFIHGASRPVLTAKDLAPLPELLVPDLTYVPFFAVDNRGSRDPEDIIYHERLPNGNTLLMIGVVLFMRVAPHNKFAEWAMLAGESVYGRQTTVPLFHEEYAHGEAAFLEGQKRYGLLCATELSPTGAIKKLNISIAKMMNHKQFNYPQVNGILSGKRNHPMGEQLKSLARLTSILESHPLPGAGFIGRGGLIGSEQMIGQCSILSKYVYPLRMEEFNRLGPQKIPILYRVHSAPTAEHKERYLDLIAQTSYPAAGKVFDDHVEFRKTLDWLMQSGYAPLAHEILYLFFQRGFYSCHNLGHRALNLPGYAPLKARKAGWINQIQARARLLGTKGYSLQELKSMEGDANLQRQRNDYKAYKLRILEDISELEDDLGKTVTGRVTRVRTKNNSLYVQVPGKQRWGIIRLKGTGKQASDIRKGKKIKVKLEGLDTRCLRGSYLLQAG